MRFQNLDVAFGALGTDLLGMPPVLPNEADHYYRVSPGVRIRSARLMAAILLGGIALELPDIESSISSVKKNGEKIHGTHLTPPHYLGMSIEWDIMQIGEKTCQHKTCFGVLEPVNGRFWLPFSKERKDTLFGVPCWFLPDLNDVKNEPEALLLALSHIFGAVTS